MSNILQAQNDAFRANLFSKGKIQAGKCVVTVGIDSLSFDDKARILLAVQEFSDFNEGNDTYGEHDFGEITLPNLDPIIWKIDYYADEDCTYGAEEPAKDCFRILTVMFADEY